MDSTAIPDDPFNSKFGIRAGKRDGSFCELSKLGTKSTCKIIRNQIKGYDIKTRETFEHTRELKDLRYPGPNQLRA